MTHFNDKPMTDKQLAFIDALSKTMPNGIDQPMFIDEIIDELRPGWNAMSIGAMISSLREKTILTTGISVVTDMDKTGKRKIERKSPYIQFTESGLLRVADAFTQPNGGVRKPAPKKPTKTQPVKEQPVVEARKPGRPKTIKVGTGTDAMTIPVSKNGQLVLE